jgi:hypothetical protein
MLLDVGFCLEVRFEGFEAAHLHLVVEISCFYQLLNLIGFQFLLILQMLDQDVIQFR